MTPNVTVIVPTFNERESVAELVARITAALHGAGISGEILFADDSTDGTPAEVKRVAEHATLPVRVLHRETRTGGLGGAVVFGLQHAAHDVCVVMDGDLQHPPELLPALVDSYSRGDADVVIATRYARGGDSHGLGTALRFGVSRGATLLAKAMFPVRLWHVSDPMTGFFLVDRAKLDLAALRPQGFKVLLEMLVRSELSVAEVPMVFGPRVHGSSKASLRQGAGYLMHLTRLRFGKMSLFALVGALGAIANLAIMWLLMRAGVNYLWAAIIGAEATIIGNFVLFELLVFRDLRGRAARLPTRFLSSFTFNNVEAAMRIPVLAFLVESWHIGAVFASALTLVAAFIVRFLFHALVVYRPLRGRDGHDRAHPATSQARRPDRR